MDVEFKPIIYTYRLSLYLSFLEDVFQVEPLLLGKQEASFKYNATTFSLIELTGKSERLFPNFEINVHHFKELEALEKRLEFYYYRQGIKEQSKVELVAPAHYQLLAMDPDQRMMPITFKQIQPEFKANLFKDTYN